MTKKPNIVVFMTDQQNALTINPESPVHMPHVKNFLKNAAQFTEAYCPSPHCCPSRATFFSGLYPSQHNVWNNVEVCNAVSRDLYDGITLFPEYLRRGGYNTFFSGKWHVSAFKGPQDCGFNEVLREFISNYGRFTEKNVPHYEDWEYFYSKSENIDTETTKKGFGQIVRPGYPHYHQFGETPNPFGDTDTVKSACEKITLYNSDDPFFMYVGTVGPHDPYTPPQEFLDLYDIHDIELPDTFADPMTDKPALYRRTREQFRLTEEEHRESLRRYYAFCSYEDSLFGQLMQTIREKGIQDNTIVVYLTDHGDYLGAHGLWAKGLPCFREAYRICAAIGGGAFAKAKKIENFVSLADFAPTFLEIAGIPIPDGLTGKSLVPLLKNGNNPSFRTDMFTQTNGNEVYGIQRAVFNKKWKYVLNSFDYDELYDLESDPGELKNLAQNPDYKSVIKELCKKLWLFARGTHDTFTCPYIMVALAPYGPGIILEGD